MPYKQFDGWRGAETDTRYLSIGISQWSAKEVSLKIMRYKEQWSRQSEELPLHRVIDSSIFLAKVLLDRDKQSVEMERSLFTNQPEGFRIKEEPASDQDKSQFDSVLNGNDKALRDRFNKLYQMLSNLKAQGKL
jgi:hypothetical protein